MVPQPELPKPHPRRTDLFQADCASGDGWYVQGCFEAVVAATDAHWSSKHPASTISVNMTVRVEGNV
jgi:hypothetical protein